MTISPPPPDIDLSRFSLRAVRGSGADRGFLIGGSGCGKSKLAQYLGADWDRRYWDRKGKRLILDRKPRFKAEWQVNGLPAKRLYKHWDQGEFVPGSVLVYDPDDLDLAWSLGYHVAIVQGTSDADNPRMLAVAQRFHDKARLGRPQLLYVDETLYFFHGNGMPKGGNDILKIYAVGGRERGLASLFASQRAKGFPSSILEEVNRLYVFFMDDTADVKVLQRMGCPITDAQVPDHKYRWMYWYKERRRELFGPYQLDL